MHVVAGIDSAEEGTLDDIIDLAYHHLGVDAGSDVNLILPEKDPGREMFRLIHIQSDL